MSVHKNISKGMLGLNIFNKLTYKNLTKLYRKEKKTLIETSRIIGCSASTIFRYLKKFKIHIRNLSEVHLCSIKLQKACKKHGFRMGRKYGADNARKLGKKYGPINGKKMGPINIKKAQERYAKYGPSEKQLKQCTELYRRLGKENGLKNSRSKRILWLGVYFRSYDERKMAKILLNNPVDGINCNVVIDGKEIDFYPQANDRFLQNHFVEYHPINCFNIRRNENFSIYCKQRRSLVLNSKYKNIPLIVIRSLSDFKKTIDFNGNID